MLRLPLTGLMILLMLTACTKNSGDQSRTPPPPNGPGGGPSTPLPANNSLEAKMVTINGNVGGFYESLPPAYDSTSKKFPLLVFLHGGGELGNGTTDLPLVLKNGLPKRLKNKTFPASFISKSDTFSFVIVAPQFREWPRPADVQAVIDYAVANYKVDENRIYLSGMSMGGGATWEYAAVHGNKLAAIVPICGASWADTTTARKIAGTHVPAWAFHNEDDSSVTVQSTTRYINIIKLFNPNPAPRVTLWPSGGHDAWTKATDPGYKEDNKNMYEWMLQFTR